MIRLVIRLDSRRYRFQDLGRDGGFVVGIMVLRDEFLDLCRRQDPTDVK